MQSVCMTSRSVDMMRKTVLSGSIVSLNILKSMENSLTGGNKEVVIEEKRKIHEWEKIYNVDILNYIVFKQYWSRKEIRITK